MSKQTLVLSYCEVTGQHALLADDGVSAWLYLHARPSSDSGLDGVVVATAFAYNRIQPIPVSEVNRYRPNPPPIAHGFASETAVVNDPGKSEWLIRWFSGRDVVVLFRDQIPWCMIHPHHSYGCSRSIQKTGPWGDPWPDTSPRDWGWLTMNPDC